MDDAGFCDQAGHRYVPDLLRAGSGPATEPPSTELPSGPAGLPPTVADTRYATGPFGTEPAAARRSGPASRSEVALPWIDEPDDSAPPTTFAVPEQHRVCGNCARPVGRGWYGQPSRTEGYCGKCGAPYSFVPTLRGGDVLEDRYRVIRPLGHGGLSWAYQALDTHLGRTVVLKGLIRAGDVWGAESIHTERDVLTVLDHPGIARIHDFVTHTDPVTGKPTEYIVMEYAGGWTLLKLRNKARSGQRPMPVRDVISYGMWILDAFDYLHDRGLLYCDLKPENVIHRGSQLKLIDMGAVRAISDRKSPAWGTKGFQVPAQEIKARGLTVRSDLHTVGRTLEVLFGASVGGHPEQPAPPESQPAVDSFRLLLARATHPDWHCRFESAARMREQLHGVLREITALEEGRPDPVPSTLFGGLPGTLDAGLGTVPELRAWTAAPASAAILAPEVLALADGRPAAASVATMLPGPLPDPLDPAAAFLTTVDTTDPKRLLVSVAGFPAPSVEIALLRCRAHLALADFDAAQRAVHDAAALVPAATDWRLVWHRALLALSMSTVDGEQVRSAYDLFGQVRAWLPGEMAPRLALGLTAEQLHRPVEASSHFTSVWRVDGTAVSAVFGLARTHLARGERDAAVRILDEVPQQSRHYDAARIAAVRVRAGHFAVAGEPGVGDLVDAVRRLAPENFPGVEAARQRARLLVFVLLATLHRVSGKKLEPSDIPDGDAPAVPVSADILRTLLSDRFRELAARQADSEIQHNTLVDLANVVRPWTRW